MQHPVELDVREVRLRDVVLYESEAVVLPEQLRVGAGAGEEVVDREDLVSLREEPLRQVGAEEAGGSGDENPH